MPPCHQWQVPRDSQQIEVLGMLKVTNAMCLQLKSTITFWFNIKMTNSFPKVPEILIQLRMFHCWYLDILISFQHVRKRLPNYIKDLARSVVWSPNIELWYTCGRTNDQFERENWRIIWQVSSLHVHPIHAICLRRQVSHKGNFHCCCPAKETQSGTGEQKPQIGRWNHSLNGSELSLNEGT